ncbi:hypothetical protein GCM10011386_37010 [Parapedobacter defluvii]|uniref:Uncharacterized protein n=1 Tax=Parapedobacter defluvii TaxID=2045106 RepID=A0ABQ1MMA5_9SPHI|nr:hypothetical protein [Parapedobacter defluvii]RQP09263.1 MAG: hypothetical protein EAS52_24055 [Parapedobacter sp.]GGC41489.1 hypothetical protein GCM10011386_37010 [Parapedobacter defluvii]
MNSIRRFLALGVLAVILAVSIPRSVQAQCAMCTLTAENATENGNTQGKGLNKGILFLLAIPYLAAAGIGVLWYKRYRGKKTVNVDNDPIVLN